MEKNTDNFTRPENLLEALGINFKKLTEEERTMQTLLLEAYKKNGKILFTEVKNWRENNPNSSLSNAIRSLYQKMENEE